MGLGTIIGDCMGTTPPFLTKHQTEWGVGATRQMSSYQSYSFGLLAMAILDYTERPDSKN